MKKQSKLYEPKKTPAINPEEKVEEPIIPSSSITIYTVTTFLNLRKRPARNAEIIRVMSPGTIIEAIRDLGDWIEIDDGFCMKEYLRKI